MAAPWILCRRLEGAAVLPSGRAQWFSGAKPDGSVKNSTCFHAISSNSSQISSSFRRTGEGLHWASFSMRMCHCSRRSNTRTGGLDWTGGILGPHLARPLRQGILGRERMVDQIGLFHLFKGIFRFPPCRWQWDGGLLFPGLDRRIGYAAVPGRVSSCDP